MPEFKKNRGFKMKGPSIHEGTKGHADAVTKAAPTKFWGALFGGAAKAAGKTALKEGAKTAAKAAAKGALKEGVKTAAKGALKEGAKTAVKEGAKGALKEGAKGAAKSAVKEGAKKTMKEKWEVQL